MMAQDAAGQYKLSAVDVLYTYISRASVDLTVTDAYGFGITQVVSNIPAAVPFTSVPMQLTDAALVGVGINLNVTLNADGSGSIAEGSYYPDVNTITDENGLCVTLQQVLPVTDVFTYESMGNGMAAFGFAHPGVNVLGLPGISSMGGQQTGLLGLSGSLTFEDFPMAPSHPTLCGDDGNCFDFTVGDIDGSGTIEIYPSTNLLGIPEYVPGGAPLTGLTGGFFLDDQCEEDGSNCNSDGLSSVYSAAGNIDADFYLEWHGVDGSSSGLGWGDLEEVDEDGDGTWFDRQIGIPAIPATYMNPACGFTQPIFGDVSATFEAIGMGSCVDYVDVATSGYLMDPSGSLATWGNTLTAHAAVFGLCVQSLGEATCAGIGGGVLLQDDSTYDVDPACLSDYNPADLTTILDCAGRLTMNFDIPCVPVIEAREVVAEFIAVGGGECGSGDMNADGSNNVLDVVALVNCVLNANCDGCTGDMNADGSHNVLDVVALVNCVLNANCGSGRVDNATSLNGAKSAEFKVVGNEVTMTADGNVVAVQMTLSHGNDFVITLTDNAYIAEHITEGNTTTLMIVNPETSSLFTANTNFVIESIEAASNSQTLMETSVVSANTFEISAASPNPFNPATQIQLNLNTDAMVSVKVFNTMGQLVDVIASGQMQNGTYSFTWDGSNAASGVYLVQTQVGAEIHNQKVMLIK
jgi:hypothetical protein